MTINPSHSNGFIPASAAPSEQPATSLNKEGEKATSLTGVTGQFGFRKVSTIPSSTPYVKQPLSAQLSLDTSLRERSISSQKGVTPELKPINSNRTDTDVDTFMQRSISLPEPRTGIEELHLDESPLSLRNNPFLVAENLKLKPISSAFPAPSLKYSLKTIAKSIQHINAFEQASGKKTGLQDQVLIGMDKVANYKNQGIPKSYLEKMQAVADEKNTIIAIRPVEKICRTLIEEGYASKGLKIKGKSSNWGPMAGFIPVNQHFSKISGNREQEQKYSQINQNTLQQKNASEEHLHISSKRIDELSQLGILSNMQETATFGTYQKGLRFDSKPSNGSPESFEAHQRTDGQWDIFSGTANHREPLQVIPVTADFDLLFAHSPYENVDLGTHDRIQTFDSELGLVSKRKIEIINALNTAFDRGEGKNMVHHGADTHNPVTDTKTNLPATVIIPESMLSKMSIYTESPILIKTPEELSKLYRAMIDNGIRVETNPLWSELRKVSHENINRKIDQFRGRRTSL